jgi:hypothetical protein
VACAGLTKKTMSIPPGSRTASPTNADDIRVGSIAAQLEEAEQKRLTDDYRIEGQRACDPHGRPHERTTRNNDGALPARSSAMSYAHRYSCWSGLSQ